VDPTKDNSEDEYEIAILVILFRIRHNNNNNSIQFNSVYLCASLTALRPITKRAQVEMERRNTLIQTNTRSNAILIIIIIIIVLVVIMIVIALRQSCKRKCIYS
jgi:hypothetical protein